MRRSICHCEPSFAFAGESRTWKFIFTPSATLPKKTKIKFDLQSNGRDIDWQIPSVNIKKPGAVIYAELAGEQILAASEVENPDGFGVQYEFVLPSSLDAGEPFTIVLGAKQKEKPSKSNTIRAQTSAHRRRPFLLYVDPSGKGRYEDPEVFSLDVRGGELTQIRMLSPSFVIKNKRFDVIVRFEDEFGNLTNHAPDDTLIQLSHEHLRENLNWKLFVPETGFISLPNLYFNDAGTYTIQLVNVATKQTFRSSPIRCFPENSNHLFWGTLHGESERFDSTESIENCLRYFRDDKAFQFYGVSPFESQEETSQDLWKQVGQNVAEFDENDRFTTFLGLQWQGERKKDGLRLFIFAKDNKQMLRNKDLKTSNLSKIYKSASPKELISVPCYSMAKETEYNFENFDPQFERVVEIYNAWGSSEITKKEGNTRPISSQSKFHESAEGSIQKALLNNCRFGFIAGGLDDRGVYAELFESDQEQYSPGLTAIIATAHSREAIFDALYRRSCYATTGERMIVGLYVAGASMGKEISTAEKPGLIVNRHLSGYVAGTAMLTKVEIIRNGKVLKTFTPKEYFLDFAYDDMSPLEKVVLPAKNQKPPFIYYYLRVTQADGHIAWSSPIWVDYIPLSSLPKIQNKKPTPKPAPIEDFDDEEDLTEDEDFADDDSELEE